MSLGHQQQHKKASISVMSTLKQAHDNNSGQGNHHAKQHRLHDEQQAGCPKPRPTQLAGREASRLLQNIC